MLSQSFNKTNSKRHLNNYEDEPPDKKLICDGDLLIQSLARKQTSTKINLQEQLLSHKEFQRSTEFISLNNYTPGPTTLNEFNQTTQHCDKINTLRRCGLSPDDISLYYDNQLGPDHLKSKHKNLDDALIAQRLKHIEDLIKDDSEQQQSGPGCLDRLTAEYVLAAKPDSTETKLLKFAFDNARSEESPPHPMDDIKRIETDLMRKVNGLSDVKRIRRKARNLNRQILTLEKKSVVIPEPIIKPAWRNINSMVEHSKWDLKETNDINNPVLIIPPVKTYTCKQQNYYTIKDGEIVQINPSKTVNKLQINLDKKLCVDEIKLLPKFENYHPGNPSNILYLKNLINKIDLLDDLLHVMFKDYDTVSIKVMSRGKMRGQAFVEFSTIEDATKALQQFNGTVMHGGRPVIIQFGKGKSIK